MKNNKKKGTRFERMTKKLMIGTFVVFVVGVVSLNSVESTLNINCDKLENEISSIKSDIDGLDIQKQELVAFSRISNIASEKGLTYRQSSVTAAVVGVQRD